MSFKETYNIIRPGTWLKASLAAIIAVFLERRDIGVGRFNEALLYSPIISFLLAISASFLLLDARRTHSAEETTKSKNQVALWAVVILLPLIAAWTLAIIISILSNLGFKLIILLAFETICLGFFKFTPPSGKFEREITSGLRGFSMAAGFLTGAVFLVTFPSGFTFLLFFSALLLQTTKDLIKLTLKPKEDASESTWGKEQQNVALVAIFVVMVALLVIEFLPLLNPYLYLWGLIVIEVLFLISWVLLLLKNTHKGRKAVNAILKIGIFVFFLITFLAGF